MAASGAISLNQTTPRIFAGRDTTAASKRRAELHISTPRFSSSIHRLRSAKSACDRRGIFLLRSGGTPLALRNVSGAPGGGERTSVVQCRAADNSGAGGDSRNGAAAPRRRQSSRAEAEQDRQFVAELRRVMDSKNLPKLNVPSLAQLADRPDLAKGLRARGQFHVARLLGQHAASEKASPPPSRPQGFPISPPIISPLDAQTFSPTSSQTPSLSPKANGGLSPPPPARTSTEPPAIWRLDNPPRPTPKSTAPVAPASADADSPLLSIFDQLQANVQRAPASGGGKSARSGVKGIPLPSRDPQATTEAVERLRQLGSAPGSEAPATPAAPAASPPRSSRSVTSPTKPVTSPTKPVTSSAPSVSERAARFLQTGKMEGAAAAEDSTSAESEGSGGPTPDAPTAESIAAQKAALLKAKLRQRTPAPPAPAAAPVLDSLQTQNEQLYRDILTEQQQLQQMSRSERLEEDDFKAQTFQELKRIKEVLTSRESEVASMAEALKEARAQLNLLRAKSAAELSQARQEMIELQTRLRSAEKALEGLKQVRVEYWGLGDVVQLAGSFNGWSEHFTLEPDLSTEIPPPGGGRGPMVFSCELRLYPGEYEVKFIVDGTWQVDSRREIVNKGLNQNNLLRVE